MTFSFMLLSQNNECLKAFNKGKELYYQENYDEALKFFKIAEFHADESMLQDIATWGKKCEITIVTSPGTLAFEANSNKNKTIQIETNALSWNFSCNSKWCIVRKTDKGLTVNCKDNEKTYRREAIIYINAGKKQVTVTVSQMAKQKIELSRDTMYFDKTMMMDSVIVKTSNWKIDSVSGGCSAIKSMHDNNVLIVFCQKNKKTYSITNNVYISTPNDNKTIIIFQEGSDVIFDVDTRDIVFGNSGGTIERKVNTNVDNFSVEYHSDWFDAFKTNDTIKVICHSNQMMSNRYDSLFLVHPYGNIPIKIRQEAAFIKVENNYDTYKFVTINYSFSLQPQSAIGLTVGYIKKFGAFVSVMSGFGFKGFSTDLSSDDNGFVNGNYPFYTGKTSKSRLSVIVGGIASIKDKVFVRAGLGYGTKKLAYETNDGKWINHSKYSYSGVDISVGAQTFFSDKFTVSLDVITTSFKAAELKLGFGLKLN